MRQPGIGAGLAASTKGSRVGPPGVAPAGLGEGLVKGRELVGQVLLELGEARAAILQGLAGAVVLQLEPGQLAGGVGELAGRGIGVVYTRRAGTDASEPRHDGKRERKGGFAFLKQFTVFSVDQCDGLPDKYHVPAPPIPEGLILPHAEVLTYMQRKAGDYDRWLGGMRRLRAKVMGG